MPGGAHQLQRAFNRLGAAVGEESAIQSRRRAKFLGEQSLVLVVIEIGDVDGFRSLIANDLHDARVRVAERIDAQSRKEVEIALAVDIENVDALAARNGQGIAGIGVQQVFLFALNDLLIGRHDCLAKVLL